MPIDYLCSGFDLIVWSEKFFWIGYGLMKARCRRVSSGEGRGVGFDGSGGDLGIVSMMLSVERVQAKKMGEIVSVSGVFQRNYWWFRLLWRRLLGIGRGVVTG